MKFGRDDGWFLVVAALFFAVAGFSWTERTNEPFISSPAERLAITGTQLAGGIVCLAFVAWRAGRR